MIKEFWSVVIRESSRKLGKTRIYSQFRFVYSMSGSNYSKYGSRIDHSALFFIEAEQVSLYTQRPHDCSVESSMWVILPNILTIISTIFRYAKVFKHFSKCVCRNFGAINHFVANSVDDIANVQLVSLIVGNTTNLLMHNELYRELALRQISVITWMAASLFCLFFHLTFQISAGRYWKCKSIHFFV